MSAITSKYDTKINHGIKSLDDAEDMQKDLYILYNLQNSNNMQFNDTKFKLLQFGKDKNKYEQVAGAGF